MCADGRFIVTPEEDSFEKADDCGVVAVALRAGVLGVSLLSAVLTFAVFWLHPLKAFPVCSTAE